MDIRAIGPVVEKQLRKKGWTGSWVVEARKRQLSDGTGNHGSLNSDGEGKGGRKVVVGQRA